jgi:hypothetical protein
MPQKVKNKITGQLHACLHVSLLPPINLLCSSTPLLPPLFSAPFSSVAVLTALALLAAAAAAAVACSACACTS